MTGRRPEPEPEHSLYISAQGGAAYGVFRGDIHVHGRAPAPYVLVPAEVAAGGPAGRRELLRAVRHDARLTVVWLHDPDSARAAADADALAAHLAARRWAVLSARPQGASTAQDAGTLAGLDGVAGILVIVKDVHQWADRSLRRLLNDAVLHHAVLPARVLFTARSMEGLPEVRGALANLQAHAEVLGPSPGSPATDPTSG